MSWQKRAGRAVQWSAVAFLAWVMVLPPLRSRTAFAAGGPATAPSSQTIKAGDGLVHAIQELGNFRYDPDGKSQIPDRVKALDGITIRLRGYMMASDQTERVSKFYLVPNLFSCCYGQPPGIEHTIMVTCRPGESVDFSPDPVVVTGTLHVKELREDGYIVSIFQVVCTSATPAPPLPKMPTGIGQAGNALQ